jgi:hypothetical protein
LFSDKNKTRQENSSQAPKIAGKLRSLVVVMTGGEHSAEDARKLFEALCQGIDESTYDAPLHTPAEGLTPSLLAATFS